MRIENTLFVQLLVGGRLEREGINAKLLSAMALITLTLAPAALLLMIQIKFLPYHSEAITWLHRGLLWLDLAIVWRLWPAYRTRWGVPLWPKESWRLAWPGRLGAVALAYAVLVVTFPDEVVYLVATNWQHEIAPVNTLDLHGQDLIDDAKLKLIIEKNESSSLAQRWEPTLLLKERDLTEANLSDADVRRVDFSGAILNRVTLDRAWANSAHLDNSQLQGAKLDSAQLQGASLDEAQLQGASLKHVALQGAKLDSTRLEGASLFKANLQGASLKLAQLQGASLDNAQLQGASLSDAQLQGALLDQAQLQGVSLEGAQLQGASFNNAFVWRADARTGVWKDTRVAGVKTGPETSCVDKSSDCAWTVDTFEALKRQIVREFYGYYGDLLTHDPRPTELPEPGLALSKEIMENLIGTQHDPLRAVIESITKSRPAMLQTAFGRLEAGLDPKKALDGEKEMAKFWADRESESPTPEAYAKSLAGQWRELGCGATGAPYVLHALIARLGSGGTLYQFHETEALAAAFLDEAHCAGAHGLSEADKAELKEIAAPAAPQAPKP